MKNGKSTIVVDEDGHRYDLSKGVRGRHADLVGCASFRLWGELHPHFEHGRQVERALREWVEGHRPAVQPEFHYDFDSPSSPRFVRDNLVRGFWVDKDLVPYFRDEESVNQALTEWLAERGTKRRRRRQRTKT